MKWVRSNGRTLTVREVGPVEYELTLTGNAVPIPIVDQIMTDDQARAKVRELLNFKLYKGTAHVRTGGGGKGGGR